MSVWLCSITNAWCTVSSARTFSKNVLLELFMKRNSSKLIETVKPRIKECKADAIFGQLKKAKDSDIWKLWEWRYFILEVKNLSILYLKKNVKNTKNVIKRNQNFRHFLFPWMLEHQIILKSYFCTIKVFSFSFCT